MLDLTQWQARESRLVRGSRVHIGESLPRLAQNRLYAR